MSSVFLEGVSIVPAFSAVVVDTDADQTGDYVCLKGYGKLGVLYVKAAGSNTDIPTLTVYQATTVTGGSAKVATVVDTVWIKQAATTLAATADFTKTAQTLASTVVGDATSDTDTLMQYFEIDAQDLDVDNGFDCVRVDVVNAASVGVSWATLLYFLLDPRYPQATSLSAIAN